MRKSSLRLVTALGTSGCTLLAPSLAQAFDEVSWTWSKRVDELIVKDLSILASFQPTGMLELQDLQIQVGDVTATSTVTNVVNDPAGPWTPTDPGGGDPGGENPGGEDPPGNEEPPLPPLDLNRGISNVVFYLVDTNGDLQQTIKFDYLNSDLKDGNHPLGLYALVQWLADAGLTISGYTIKGGQDITNVGTIPDGATPENFSDVDLEYAYDPNTGQLFVLNEVTDTYELVDTSSFGTTTTSSIATASLPDAPSVNAASLPSTSPVTTALVGLDASTHLPEVLSQATAVANVVALESDVMIELHDTQIAFGDFGDQPTAETADAIAALFDAFYQPAVGSTEADGFTGNLGISSAMTLLVAGAAGVIEPGTVSATSRVSRITNASVDSDATAVANTASATLDAASAGDAVFVGDVTQFSYMTVRANSNVDEITVSGYKNAGFPFGRPLVSSVATAVGNNLSVAVETPDAGLGQF